MSGQLLSNLVADYSEEHFSIGGSSLDLRNGDECT